MRKPSIYKLFKELGFVALLCAAAMPAIIFFLSPFTAQDKSAATTEDTLLSSVVDTAQYTSDIGGYTDSVRITIVDSNNNISKQVMIYYK